MRNQKSKLIGLAFLLGASLCVRAQVVVPSIVECIEVQVCWESTPNVVYQVQFQESGGATWADLGSSLSATASETCVATEYVEGRSFRVVLQPAVPPTPAGPPEMAWISAGNFTMGSPTTEVGRNLNEGPQTFVTISRGFWMDKYEVSQAKYLSVVGVNPSANVGNLQRPVEMVSWVDATNYCRLLTDRERAAGRLPLGYVYRLPTEAEWEYACRAGTTTAFSFGPALRSGMANTDGRKEYPPCPPDTGWCTNRNGIMLYSPVSVGSYPANPWGLHDMHGNVWEWTADWQGSSHPGGSVTDPKGVATAWGRVIKGGRVWIDADYAPRSAWRHRHVPTGGRNDLGFRAVLGPAL